MASEYQVDFGTWGTDAAAASGASNARGAATADGRAANRNRGSGQPAFRGIYFQDFNHPDTVAPGDQFEIWGHVSFDSFGTQDQPVRVVAESQRLGTNIDNLGPMGPGSGKDFRIEYGASNVEPGDTFHFTVEAQREAPFIGWSIKDTKEFSIEVVSEDTKERQEVEEFVGEFGPYVVGGAGVGALSQLGQPVGRLAAATVGGGAAGLLAKEGMERFTDVDINQTDIALTAAALGAGGFLLMQVNEAGGADVDVTAPVRRAAGRARDAVSR